MVNFSPASCPTPSLGSGCPSPGVIEVPPIDNPFYDRPILPTDYNFWRAVFSNGFSNGTTRAWRSTLTSEGFWSSVNQVLPESTAWLAPTQITFEPGTGGAGGAIARIMSRAFSSPDGNVSLWLYQGGVGPSVPVLAVDPAYSFEFSNDGLIVLADWAGVPFPIIPRASP